MEAGLVEMIVRSANAVMATVAFALLLRGWAHPRMPAMPLMRFLTMVVGMQMVWRGFVLWLGFQPAPADPADNPWYIAWVQPLTASLLFLLLLAIALLAYFHLRAIFPGEDARHGVGGAPDE